MKVIATKSVHFPTLNWGINAGQERDLPEDKASQDFILAHNAISKVAAPNSRKETVKN
jgi:hypothetical protein